MLALRHVETAPDRSGRNGLHTNLGQRTPSSADIANLLKRWLYTSYQSADRPARFEKSIVLFGAFGVTGKDDDRHAKRKGFS
jgi:hypothetical protein